MEAERFGGQLRCPAGDAFPPLPTELVGPDLDSLLHPSAVKQKRELFI